MTALGKERILFPRETVIGAMANYVANGGTGAFQPMNANFGIVAPLEHRVKGGKKVKNEALAERALNIVSEISRNINQGKNL